MKQFFQDTHYSLPLYLSHAAHGARSRGPVPSPDADPSCNKSPQLILIALFGHTSTQAPHPQHASAFTFTETSPSVIASIGQLA